MSRFHPRLLAPAVAVALVAGTAWAVPAAGDQPAPSAQPATARSASLQPVTVTLVTGDRVTTRKTQDGTVGVEVHPGPGREGVLFHKLTLGKQQSVVPVDAVPLIAAGIVDPRLFDVALLADLGLDDASSPTLPLMIRYAGQPRAVRQSLPAGTTVDQELPIVDAVAVRQERTRATDLWRSWTSTAQAKRRTALSPTVKKVWLDGGIKPNLDRSVAQIGAPTLWRHGITGKGVKVAVLDTGYDATHPDLKDRVVATDNFTTDTGVVDRIGHGTHVASTVAGTGAASGGKYRGVAPDADLMIGKICGSRNCEDSDIMEGMQWAATHGARVVNLSVGGGPTDGTDLVAQAVNELTASTGTLFVASAGNFGADGTVGSPAAADSALAVASVTKSDTLSVFSSRGPRLGDLAVKPDIAAPGDRIVAARAANTPLESFAVNASYAELSGTSMAAPHVTGAAALLAQLHPDWKAPELKSALMNSALDLKGLGVFAQGAGRVDLDRALTQTVIASPSSLNFGLQTAPHTDDKPVTRQVTYRNDSSKPVTLSLHLQASTRVFRLAKSLVKVPAHGTATVDVTANTATNVPDGPYGGWLIARGNGMEIRSTIGVGKQVPSFTQELKMLDRDGKPAVNDDQHVSGAYVVDVDRKVAYLANPGDKLQLPRGRYLVDAFTTVFNANGLGFRDATYFGEPDLVVDRPGTITLDGRKARKIALKSPVTGAHPAAGGVGFVRPLGDETYVGGVGVATSFEPDFFPNLYVVPNVTGSRKTFTGFAHLAWAGMPDGQSPDRDFFLDSPYVYHDVTTWPGRFPANPSLVTDRRDYAHLDASYASADAGVKANNYSYPTLPAPEPSGRWTPLFVFTPAVVMNLPFRRDEYYSAKGVAWAFENELYRRLPDDGVEYTALVDSQHVVYPAGRTTKVNWQRGVFGPSLTDARGGLPGRDKQPWTFRDGDSLNVVALMHSSGAGTFGDALTDSERTTVTRNGVEIGASDAFKQQTFALPAEPATYVLKKEVTRGSDERFKLSTRSEVAWTFRSARTPDGVASALPLMTVRWSPVLDERNAAPGGRFEVPLTVEHQYGGPRRPVVSVAVQASYDDGRSWVNAAVRRTARGWTASLTQPSSGFVSLRTVAIDAAGNKVDQRVTRAYALR
ncbi:S8 family serine peptidase [Kribbella sp. NPDC051770]|uniref:S8 family peptidase n=1 Tax=Kribbella sp. NPDC051770 TaxID=3155413 RepID=UPI003423DF5A